MRKQKGITLITLVITIIVLLILVGVSIAMLTGDNGILTKAQAASEKTNKAKAKEKVQVAVMGSYNSSGKLDYTQLKTNLDNVEGITKSTVPETITEESFDIKVTVDGYGIIIKKNGEVEVEGVSIGDNENDDKPTELPDNTEETEKDDFVTKEEYNTFLAEYQNLKSEQEKLKQEMGDLTEEVEALKNRSATYMIDTSRVLKSLEIGEVYTATEDCIFVGVGNVKPGGWWDLYVDRKYVGSIGENGAGNIALNFPSIFLKKGSTIQVTGSSASEYFYDMILMIYGIK